MTAAPEKTHVVKEFSHKSPLIACRFDARGRYVFASAEDRTVRRWDLATGKESCARRARQLGFRPRVPSRRRDDHHRRRRRPAHLVARHGRKARAHAPRAGAPRLGARPGDQPRRFDRRIVRQRPDGPPLVVRRRLARCSSCPAMSCPSTGCCSLPTGARLISADLRGLVIEWDHRPGKEARRLDAGKLSKHNAAGQGVDYGGVRDLALSADGKYLACGGLIEASNPLGAVSNPAVLVFDWQTGKESKLLRPKENVLGLVWGLRFHPSGFLIAASGGNAGGHLWFWKPDQANELFKLTLAQHRARHGPAPRRHADRDGPSRWQGPGELDGAEVNSRRQIGMRFAAFRECRFK